MRRVFPARITGVNAVTLRAWERRYGLIVPHRTAKRWFARQAMGLGTRPDA